MIKERKTRNKEKMQAEGKQEKMLRKTNESKCDRDKKKRKMGNLPL